MKNIFTNFKKFILEIVLFFNNLKNFSKINYRNLLKDENKIADKTIKYGVFSLIVFFVIFLLWAIFLPINSAIVSQGTVILDFNRKIIQHLEGGIINKILVKEGDFVEKDQTLMILNDIKSNSDQKSLLLKYWSLKLQRNRLISEKNNEEEININSFLKQINFTENFDENDELQEIILTQNQLFNAKMQKTKGEIELLEQKLIESQNLLNSTLQKEKITLQKISLIRQELKMIKKLVLENNISLSQQISLKKQLIDAQNQNYEIINEIDKLKQQIIQNKLQIINYKNDNLSNILEEIKKTEYEISTIASELQKDNDISSRLLIKSPVFGKVMDMKYHTIGAVIQTASPIMTIVPQNDKLIIEARIKPQDIESIKNGMKSRIALTSYKDKKVPKFYGKVINVSADIFTDERTSESYFKARIEIDKNEILKLKDEVEIIPGMPVQVFVITGKRTLLQYLFSPIKDSAYKAFREE